MSSNYIKNYQIKECLGRGTYGDVYKVIDNKRPHLKLVIKKISLLDLSSFEIEEFKQEARILASINSPYITKHYESFIDNDNLIIVMEYCEGGDLKKHLFKFQKIKSTYFPEDIIWKYFIELCLGLNELHKRNILHRDLKSMNIFLNCENKIKIGDLGIAKVVNKSGFAHTFIGTPYYLSPEICEEKPYNTKSDIWALGCILYEMATFKPPFTSNNQGGLILKILQGSYESIPKIYSNNLKKMISYLLEKNYHKRPSITDILNSKITKDISNIIGYNDILKFNKNEDKIWNIKDIQDRPKTNNKHIRNIDDKTKLKKHQNLTKKNKQLNYNKLNCKKNNNSSENSNIKDGKNLYKLKHNNNINNILNNNKDKNIKLYNKQNNDVVNSSVNYTKNVINNFEKNNNIISEAKSIDTDNDLFNTKLYYEQNKEDLNIILDKIKNLINFNNNNNNICNGNDDITKINSNVFLNNLSNNNNIETSNNAIDNSNYLKNTFDFINNNVNSTQFLSNLMKKNNIKNVEYLKNEIENNKDVQYDILAEFNNSQSSLFNYNNYTNFVKNKDKLNEIVIKETSNDNINNYLYKFDSAKDYELKQDLNQNSNYNKIEHFNNQEIDNFFKTATLKASNFTNNKSIVNNKDKLLLNNNNVNNLNDTNFKTIKNKKLFIKTDNKNNNNNSFENSDTSRSKDSSSYKSEEETCIIKNMSDNLNQTQSNFFNKNSNYKISDINNNLNNKNEYILYKDKFNKISTSLKNKLDKINNNLFDEIDTIYKELDNYNNSKNKTIEVTNGLNTKTNTYKEDKYEEFINKIELLLLKQTSKIEADNIIHVI